MKFNPYNKPFEPRKPTEKLTSYITIKKQNIATFFSQKIEDFIKSFPSGATHVEFYCDHDVYNGDSITAEFSKEEIKPNPKYEIQLKQYQKDYTKYKEELAEFNKQLEIYNKNLKKQSLLADKKLFDKLKKKFGEK